MQRSRALFDHFVGPYQQRGRHGETQRFGCLYVDYKDELRWPLYREVHRFGTPEDFVYMVARLTE